MSPDEIQKEGWSILPPCLAIAAVALYISFCRQSALAAEAEHMHQSRIRKLWQQQSFSEALSKSLVLQISYKYCILQEETDRRSIGQFMAALNQNVYGSSHWADTERNLEEEKLKSYSQFDFFVNIWHLNYWFVLCFNAHSQCRNSGFHSLPAHYDIMKSLLVLRLHLHKQKVFSVAETMRQNNVCL